MTKDLYIIQYHTVLQCILDHPEDWNAWTFLLDYGYHCITAKT